MNERKKTEEGTRSCRMGSCARFQMSYKYRLGSLRVLSLPQRHLQYSSLSSCIFYVYSLFVLFLLNCLFLCGLSAAPTRCSFSEGWSSRNELSNIRVVCWVIHVDLTLFVDRVLISSERTFLLNSYHVIPTKYEYCRSPSKTWQIISLSQTIKLRLENIVYFFSLTKGEKLWVVEVTLKCSLFMNLGKLLRFYKSINVCLVE